MNDQEFVKHELSKYERGRATVPKRTLFSWLSSFLKIIGSQKEEINELKGDIQRIYERAEEAFADHPDHYALSIALTMIRKWSYERLNPIASTQDFEAKANCTHKDVDGEFTVIIDGDTEQCTQCGQIGK